MKVLKHCILKTSVFFTLFLAASVTSNAQNRKIGINTVVIDAGHGGPDAGAVGRLYKEKDINLDVALRFGRMISEHYPDVQVIYTRKTDVLIPLAERGDIANRAKADLFISIHINSNKSSSPSGVSVYVMGVDKASKNMDVAMKENDVITYEEDYSTRYQGYKPGSTESLIMFSLMQYAYQTQSCLLADMVQKQSATRKCRTGASAKRAFWCCGAPRCRASCASSDSFRTRPRKSSSDRKRDGRPTRGACSTLSASTRSGARAVAH